MNSTVEADSSIRVEMSNKDYERCSKLIDSKYTVPTSKRYQDIQTICINKHIKSHADQSMQYR